MEGLALQKVSATATVRTTTGDQMQALLYAVASERCKASFAKLFEHFAPRLRSYGIKQLGNEAIAMELVQDTLTTVWQKAHLFDANKGAASTWIFTIARNIRFDALRKMHNRKEDVCAEDLWPLLSEQLAAPEEDNIEAQITLSEVKALFGKLPDKQRRVVEALYIEGKSQVELAEQLQIPLGTVKSRTRLALSRLKELMKDND